MKNTGSPIFKLSFVPFLRISSIKLLLYNENCFKWVLLRQRSLPLGHWHILPILCIDPQLLTLSQFTDVKENFAKDTFLSLSTTYH